MNKKIIVSISILILAVLASGFWFTQKRQEIKNSVNQDDVVINDEIDREEDGKENRGNGGLETNDKIGLKTYTNEEYGYALDYPSDWVLTDHYDDLGEGRVIGFRYVSLKLPDNFVMSIGVKNESEGEWVFAHSRRTGIPAGDFIQIKKINILEGVAVEKSLIYKYPERSFTQLVWFCALNTQNEEPYICNDFSIGKGMVARAEIDYVNNEPTEDQWKDVKKEAEKILRSLQFID